MAWIEAHQSQSGEREIQKVRDRDRSVNENRTALTGGLKSSQRGTQLGFVTYYQSPKRNGVRTRAVKVRVLGIDRIEGQFGRGNRG